MNIEIRQAANQKRENDNDQVSSEPKQLVGIEAKRWHVDAGSQIHK